jgi:hypothetical protein
MDPFLIDWPVYANLDLSARGRVDGNQTVAGAAC